MACWRYSEDDGAILVDSDSDSLSSSSSYEIRHGSFFEGFFALVCIGLLIY